MKFNQWLRVTIFVMLIAVVTMILSSIFERKGSMEAWNRFYNQENESVDIVVLGSSLLAVGINPYHIYENTGYKTFNLTFAGEPASVHYAQINEIAKTQKPKLVIIETFRYVGGGRSDVDNATHCIAGMRGSINKYWLIAGLPLHEGKFYRMELLVPLFAHHNRWENLTADDFKLFDRDNSKEWWSSDYKTGIFQTGQFTFPTYEVTQMDDLCKKNLEKTIQAAKDNNIKLLFFNPPNPEYDEGWYGAFNAMYQYLDEQGIDWLDCNYDAEFMATMDVTRDYCDYHHLNDVGALKTEKYLSDYINNKYHFDE